MTDQPPITTPAAPYSYKTIADIEDQHWIRALLFAPPKAGKTGLLLTFPEPAIADFDGGGVKVAKSPWFRTNHPRQLEPGVIRFQEFANERDQYGVVSTHNAFFDSIAWINQVIKDDSRKTVGLDSLTMLSRVALEAALPVLNRRGRSKSWSHAATDHMLLLAMQDFGGEMSAVEQLLDQLQKIKNKHVIVTAHERQETTDSGAIMRRSPLVTGDRLRARIAHWFDEVWYLDVDASGKRILRCQPYGVLHGVGSRLGLPAVIEDPSYEKIMRTLEGGKL